MIVAELATHLLTNVGLVVFYLLLLTAAPLSRRQSVAATAPRSRLDVALFTILVASLPGLLLGVPSAELLMNVIHDALLIASVSAIVSGLHHLFGHEAGPLEREVRLEGLALRAETARRREAEARISRFEAEMEAQISARTAALAAVTAALEKELVERRLAQLRFSEGRRWIDELMLRTNTAMVLIDRETRVVESNEALARLLRRKTLAEMLNCDLGQFLGQDDHGRLRHFCDETLRLGTFTCQFEAVASDGGAIAIEADGVASVQNGVPCIMALLHDVSARSAAQRELMRGCDKLSAALGVARLANASRPAFLARLNRELRTSLSGIIGLNEMLRHTASARTLPGSDIRKLCNGIHRSGSHLLGMVNDLLDLSRLEAGIWSLCPTRMAVRAEIDVALTTLDSIFDRVTIDNTCSPDLDFIADKQAFRLIVMKLASNAAKVSPPGSRIRIDVTCHRGALALHVTDQGPGIAESDRERMLKPFSRGYFSDDYKLDGVGLGVSIVRKLLELQGGRLRIANQIESGTTFTAILPSADTRLAEMQLAAE